jgi:hypothetical protein
MSFRDGPQDQTSDAQCASGNLEIFDAQLRIRGSLVVTRAPG